MFGKCFARVVLELRIHVCVWSPFMLPASQRHLALTF